jgi:hypothetical protein
MATQTYLTQHETETHRQSWKAQTKYRGRETATGDFLDQTDRLFLDSQSPDLDRVLAIRSDHASRAVFGGFVTTPRSALERLPGFGLFGVVAVGFFDAHVFGSTRGQNGNLSRARVEDGLRR